MKTRRLSLLAGGLLTASLAVQLLPTAPFRADVLDENCTVSVLNRNIRVNSDGSWVLPNVPANFGQVRARATCVRNGSTVSGESSLFSLPANGVVNLPDIVLGPMTRIPLSLSIAPTEVVLHTAGEAVQLTVTASYPDGSTADVSAGSDGTTFTTSNAALVAVSLDGRLTAVASGTVVIQATNEGAAGLLKVAVQLSSTDTDGDGIPDDVEVGNGLDPNNPVDAFEDPDRDGLTNKREVLDYGTDPRNTDTDGDGIQDGEEVVLGKDGYITNPNLADTDHDGFRDGLEIALGTDPTDPSSHDLCRALSSETITPPLFALTLNTIVGSAFIDLKVDGHLIDNTDLEITDKVAFSSSDLTVCSFGAKLGRAFAGTDGDCTISAAACSFRLESEGTVTRFAPKPLYFVAIPGFANNVDVSGNYAYVAAGATGLQVVDVTDRMNPRVVTGFDTPGNADDVLIAGSIALIADDSAGLHLVDVSSPSSPSLLGSIDTPGTAQDVSVIGNVAYVADGAAGLQVISFADPLHPAILGSMVTRGAAKGVGVEPGSTLAVIAEGAAGLETVDISDPAHPRALGFVSTGDAHDVILSGSFAFVADFSSSFTSVDVSNPNQPIVKASTPLDTGGRLLDVARNGTLAFGADTYFVNGVPVISVESPAAPVPKDIIDFRGFRDDNGTGIAVDESYVYMTGDLSGGDNGSSGNSRLYIGQYLAVVDRFRMPPTVEIKAPTQGAVVGEGSILSISADATDDIGVAGVQFLVNGQPVGIDSTSPYRTAFEVPLGVSSLEIGARAFDKAAPPNIGEAPPVTVSVTSGPVSTVVGRVIDESGAPVADAELLAVGDVTGLSAADGTFQLFGVRTNFGPVVIRASKQVGARKLDGLSTPTQAPAAGTTNVGDIVLSELFGNGADGALMTSNLTQVINSAYRLTADAAAGTATVSISNVSGLAQGDEVMIIQLQGPAAGTYEFDRVDGITATGITLRAPLRKSYSSTNLVANVVRVPNYTDVTVRDGTSLVAPDWDGATGGVLVFRASGVVTVEPAGRITATGKGFRGGHLVTFINACNPSAGHRGESILGLSTSRGNKNPNVGGGGAGAPDSCVGCAGDSPAGGGGYATPGATSINPGGQSNAGLGGDAYGDPDLLTRIFLGSGGGESHWSGRPGGNGGGILAVFARILGGSGTIESEGDNDGPGGGHPAGGGSGGSVLLVGDQVKLQAATVSADGGLGSTAQPCRACCSSDETEVGGDGGLGRTLYRARVLATQLNTGSGYQLWPTNGHYYAARLMTTGITWQSAQKACLSEGGYLATIGSAEENQFVFGLARGDSRYWFIDGAGNGEGPLLGGFQANASSEPAAGWQWAATAEPFTYTAWSPGEPNNAGAGESRLVFFKLGGLIGDRWNDVGEFAQLHSYICEIESRPASIALKGRLPQVRLPIQVKSLQ
jgi:hypothetical protein